MVGRPLRANECQPLHGLSTCLVADNLWPQSGGNRWLSLAPTQTIAAGSASFGFVASYISRPIGLVIGSADPEGTTVYAVDNALGATFLAGVGITERLHVGLAVPTVLYQDGAGTADVVGSEQELPRSAVGDLRWGVAVELLQRPASATGAALTGRFDLSAPTGDEAAFASAGTAVYVPGISFDHRVDRFQWSLDGAARIRGEHQLAGARLGTQLYAAAGASYDILADKWLSVGLEAFALFTLASQEQLVRDPGTGMSATADDDIHIPAEWLLWVQTAGLLDGQLSTSLSGGSFIPTGSHSAVTTPRFRFMLGIHYAYDPAQ